MRDFKTDVEHEGDGNCAMWRENVLCICVGMRGRKKILYEVACYVLIELSSSCSMMVFSKSCYLSKRFSFYWIHVSKQILVYISQK